MDVLLYISVMLTISALYIYPIKSLGGISQISATVTDRGLKNDRRWMLIDENNRFLTQRKHPQMALLEVELTGNGLKVNDKLNKAESLNVPIFPETNESTIAEIWDDKCNVQFVSKLADQWFSDVLRIKSRLVYMPDSSLRSVDENYAVNNDITCLSDGYPLTIISQASLDDLNSRLEVPIPMNRFRPNIVIRDSKPFEEDLLDHFYINSIEFRGVKRCSRCMVTTINQENASIAKEPLKTLAT